MTSNTTTDSTSPTSSNTPSNSPSATVNNGNDTQSQIHHPSSPPSTSPSTPTPQLSSLPIEGDIDPSTFNIDVARSAASISNLINHDHDDNVEHQIITSPNSQPTSQMSSRSISPAPDTPHNTINSMDFELINNNNTNNIKKKRKGSHDNDENDINHIADFDSSKRQRCNIKNLSLSIDANNTDVINNNKVSDNASAPTSPIAGFDEMNLMDDHNSDEYSGANSPTNSGNQISSPVGGNNINFPTKQTRKKPYIPRPPNSFILYRQHHHPLILNQHPGINNSEISRIIADHWRNLPNPEKEEWKRKADEAKQRHMKAWPDYKYQPRRRVVGPTFKKPLKGPDTPTSATKSEFNSQEGSMMVIELSSHKKSDRNQRNSVIIIEGGSKELKDRNGNNNSKKLSPTEAIKSKLGTPTHQHSTYPTQRLPIPSTLVPHQLQSLPSSQQQPQPMVLPNTPSSSTPSCGALIVFEGCEDSNTTLQSNQLYEFLKNEGIKAKLWKFPDTSTPSGNALKAYQSTNRQPHPKTLHLLVAAHWWELMPIMKEHLMNGITLIVDRYVYYATAESAAAGLDLHWCKSSYSQVLNPDLIFFLNMEREVNEMDKQQISLPNVNDVLGIGESDDGRKEWQRRIQDALSRLAEVQWKVLDARKSSNIINAQIITASIEVIERCRKSNAGYGNMFNNSMMSHQNQQLPPLVNGSPSSNHSLLPLSHQQQQNSNVLPPIGRRDGFSRPVHVQL